MSVRFKWPPDLAAFRFGSALIWALRGGGIPATVTGISPLSLVNAIARPITKLLQHGKLSISGSTLTCNNGELVAVDDELPIGYKRITNINFDGDFWYETNEILTGNDNVTMTLANTSLNGQNVFGSYNKTGTGVKNFSLYVYGGGASNKSYFRYGEQLLRPQFGSGERTITFGKDGTSGFYLDVTVTPETFTTVANIYIGMLPNSSSPTYTGSIVGNILVGDRLKYIPCERVSDGVIGYYEMVNGVFLEPVGTGTPAKDDYDTSHCTIISADGTPEEIVVSAVGAEDQTAHAENLFAVGDIEDTQDIISGTVIRRTEAVVSDGTTPTGRYVGTVGEGNIIVKVREDGYTGEIVSFEAEEETSLNGLIVAMEPQQDLHGYDSPWPEGGGKNKFNIDDATSPDFSISGETFTNTNTDSRALFLLSWQVFNNNTLITYAIASPVSGKVTATLTINDPCTRMVIKHNGSTRDLLINFPWTQTGTWTISMNVVSSDPTTVGGLVLSNIQIESGSTTTAWTPYSNICPISGYTGVSVKRTGKNLFPCTDAIVNNYATIEQTSINGMPGYKITGEVGWRVSFKGLRENITPGMTAVIVLYSDFSSSFQLNFGNLLGQHKIAPSKITTVIQISSGLYMHKATIEAYDATDACWNYTDQAVIPYGGVLTQADGVYTFSTPLYLLPDDTDYTYEPYQGEEVSVTFPSVNIWDEEWENGTFNTTTGANIDSGGALNQIRAKNLIPVSPDTNYYFKVPNELDITGGAWVIFYDAEETVITSGLPSGKGSSGNSRMFNNSAFKTPSNAQYIRFYMTTGYGNTYNHDISINYPSIITDYCAYGELMTVYGGTPDIVSGEMPVTMRYIVIDGNSNIGKESTGWAGNYEAFYLLIDPYRGKNVTPSVTANIVTNQLKATSYQGLRTGTNPFVITFTDNAKYLEWGSTSTTLEEEKARLTANPIQVAYELATPVEIQLTPTPITALKGYNAMWSDAGDIAVYVPKGNLIEQVEKQKLNTAEGDNTITVTAEVEDIVFDVTYRENNPDG